MIWILTHTILGDKAGMAYDFVPLDGDLSKVKIEDLTVDIGIWPIERQNYFRSGRKILPTGLPTRIQAKYDRGGGAASKGAMNIPDFFGVGRAQVVSQAFRDQVESLDPGLHQFFPVEIVWPNKNSESLTFFWFAPGKRIFALDHEKSSPPVDLNSRLYPLVGPVDLWAPVFKQDIVGDADLFVSAELAGAILVTSRLKDALHNSNLTGYRLIGPFNLSN